MVINSLNFIICVNICVNICKWNWNWWLIILLLILKVHIFSMRHACKCALCTFIQSFSVTRSFFLPKRHKMKQLLNDEYKPTSSIDISRCFTEKTMQKNRWQFIWCSCFPLFSDFGSYKSDFLWFWPVVQSHDYELSDDSLLPTAAAVK